MRTKILWLIGLLCCPGASMFAGTPEHTQAEIAARHSAAGSEGEVFKATYADWEAVPVASVGTNTTTVEATLRKPYTVADMVFSDDGSHLAVYYTSDAVWEVTFSGDGRTVDAHRSRIVKDAAANKALQTVGATNSWTVLPMGAYVKLPGAQGFQQYTGEYAGVRLCALSSDIGSAVPSQDFRLYSCSTNACHLLRSLPMLTGQGYRCTLQGDTLSVYVVSKYDEIPTNNSTPVMVIDLPKAAEAAAEPNGGPNAALPRRSPRMELKTCVQNMEMLDAAVEQCAVVYEIENGKYAPIDKVSTFIKEGIDSLRCPAGGVYTLGPVMGCGPACSVHGPKIEAKNSLSGAR